MECTFLFFFSSAGGKRIESFVECEGLDTFGRYSFNGCNKEIEVGVSEDSVPALFTLSFSFSDWLAPVLLVGVRQSLRLKRMQMFQLKK